MKLDDAIHELRYRFPIFDETYDDYEDSAYSIYDAFGSFSSDVIFLSASCCKWYQSYFCADLKEFYQNPDFCAKEVKKIFSYIDEMFIGRDDQIADILNCCIFEAWIGNDYSYNLARNYFSKETYNHYLEVAKRVV